MRWSKPSQSDTAAATLASPPPIQPIAKQVKATARIAAPAPRWDSRSCRPMPPSSARTRKPAASASDTRFEIVMVKRSLAAANAIKAGNSRRRAMSRIMDLQSRAVSAGSRPRRSLSGSGEQSENGQEGGQENDQAAGRPETTKAPDRRGL